MTSTEQLTPCPHCGGPLIHWEVGGIQTVTKRTWWGGYKARQVNYGTAHRRTQAHTHGDCIVYMLRQLLDLKEGS